MASLVISADEHLVEPAEFWQEWLPASLPRALRARAPRRVGPGIALDGDVPIRTFTLFPDLVAHSDDAFGAADLGDRLAVLDTHGVAAAVVFPQRAMAMWGVEDVDLRDACFDAYNTWLAHLCDAADGRLIGVPILHTVTRPERTAAAIDRLKDLGFTTMMLPNHPRGVRYGEANMEPLWSAIEAAGMPLNFHISEAPDGNGPGELGSYLMASFQPFRKLWSYLVFSGILERHRELRVVFAEGGISWIPSALDHADRIHAEFRAHLDPVLPRAPSDYWREQCYATFMDDPRGLDQMDDIGADRVLWSSDYPHPEGTHGRTADILADVHRRFGTIDAARIVGQNAMGLYARE